MRVGHLSNISGVNISFNGRGHGTARSVCGCSQLVKDFHRSHLTVAAASPVKNAPLTSRQKNAINGSDNLTAATSSAALHSQPVARVVSPSPPVAISRWRGLNCFASPCPARTDYAGGSRQNAFGCRTADFDVAGRTGRQTNGHGGGRVSPGVEQPLRQRHRGLHLG